MSSTKITSRPKTVTTTSTFSPTSIAGCVLWIDAADSTKITMSGSNVTQIVDKSSNAYTFTGSAGTYPSRTTTLNGLPVISSSTGRNLQTTNFNQNFTTATFFAVVRPTEDITPNGKSGNGYAAYGIVAGTQLGDFAFVVTYANQSQSGDPSKFFIEIDKQGTGFINGALGGASPSTYNPVNTPLNIGAVMTGSSGTNTAYLNGTSVNLTYNVSGTFPLQSSRTVSVFWGFGCDYAETLVYGSVLTTTQRQQVEGYLAQKWGLTASLPAGHPGLTSVFYGTTTIAPTTITVSGSFVPTSIAGCGIWLDSSDSASFTFSSGSNISQWRDKSGSSNHFTPSSGTPTYISDAGKNVVNFPSGAIMSSANQITFSSINLSAFFIVSKLTGFGSWGAMLLGFTNVNGGDYSIRFYDYILLGTQAATDGGGSLGSATYYVNGTFNPNFGSNIYFNKYTIINTVAPGTSGTSYLTLSSAFMGRTFVGTIAEFICYPGGVTSNQRLIIEAYLAQKWGLTSNLPAGHTGLTTALFGTISVTLPKQKVANIPKTLITSGSFLPTSIAGCGIWLDAADSTSFTFSTGSLNISQWRDKSGSSNHFNLTSGTTRYITDAGKDVVQFLSGGIMSSANQITFTTSSAFFIVSKLTGLGDWATLLAFTNINGSDYSIRLYTYILLGTQAYTDGGGSMGTTNYYVNGTFNPNFGSNVYLNNYTIIDTVAPSTSGTSYITLSTAFMGRVFVGNIAEFLYYPGGVTSNQRQTIEGYLAQKWGLTSNLVAGHPGLSTLIYGTQIILAPTTTTTTFLPTSIAGCQLWLDAADSSTITLSGSKVTQWNDKSGNGYNFTQSTSGNQPTYSTSSQNNQNTITFTSANSTYLVGTASTNFIGTNSLSMYGVFKTNDATSGSSVFAKSLYGGASGRILYGYRDPGTPGTIVFANSGGIAHDIPDTYTAGAWRAAGFVSDRSGWTNITYQNGTITATKTIAADTTTNLTTGFPMLVGAYNNSSGGLPPQADRYLDGAVGELLLFSTALTTGQRQQIESYLAQKWGLTSSLPAGHPGLTTTLYGSIPLPKQKIRSISPFIVATGGDSVIISNGYKMHIFTTVGTQSFTLLSNAFYRQIQVLVVGGGGGGGNNCGGGGGAGGVSFVTLQSLSVGTYSVVVGAGGSGATNPGAPAYGSAGSNGNNSSALGLTGIGGGGGGYNYVSNGNYYQTDGNSGGCGGGGGGGGYNQTPSVGGSALQAGGFAGGGQPSASGNTYGAGGGGGMGSVGSNSSGNTGGNGGSGATYTIGGNSYTLAGGGGGGTAGGATAGIGQSGGGNGAGVNNTSGANATTYGSGGGGSSGGGSANLGGNGYQGVVIIAYQYVNILPGPLIGYSNVRYVRMTGGKNNDNWNDVGELSIFDSRGSNLCLGKTINQPLYSQYDVYYTSGLNGVAGGGTETNMSSLPIDGTRFIDGDVTTGITSVSWVPFIDLGSNCTVYSGSYWYGRSGQRSLNAEIDLLDAGSNLVKRWVVTQTSSRPMSWTHPN